MQTRVQRRRLRRRAALGPSNALANSPSVLVAAGRLLSATTAAAETKPSKGTRRSQKEAATTLARKSFSKASEVRGSTLNDTGNCRPPTWMPGAQEGAQAHVKSLPQEAVRARDGDQTPSVMALFSRTRRTRGSHYLYIRGIGLHPDRPASEAIFWHFGRAPGKLTGSSCGSCVNWRIESTQKAFALHMGWSFCGACARCSCALFRDAAWRAKQDRGGLWPYDSHEFRRTRTCSTPARHVAGVGDRARPRTIYLWNIIRAPTDVAGRTPCTELRSATGSPPTPCGRGSGCGHCHRDTPPMQQAMGPCRNSARVRLFVGRVLGQGLDHATPSGAPHRCNGGSQDGGARAQASCGRGHMRAPKSRNAPANASSARRAGGMRSASPGHRGSCLPEGGASRPPPILHKDARSLSAHVEKPTAPPRIQEGLS